ncbi:MAG: carboxymethylenebutenolidase [Tepidiforma sp.]|nr:dienelactone hydrolase family protein [Tepidiforma sp.]GIW18669.1 MAG: carboxymethylenebutenolidase [Tepidiforma sp.]
MDLFESSVAVPGPGGRPMPAFLALPASAEAAPVPGVLVLHEIFGLNDDIRAQARRAASLGYAALAPDLLAALGPRPFCLVRAFRDLARGEGRAFDALDAARAWLAAHPAVDSSRLGVLGFCMGGSFALLMAARAPLRAAAVFYGAVPKDRAALEGVCPVVAGYGGRDRLFAPQGRRLQQHLAALDTPHDVVIYPAAGHSFMNRHDGVAARLGAWGPMKVGYDPAAAEDSWRRIAAFFAEHLGS